MATKTKVLEDLKDKTYSLAEVRHIIGTITHVETATPSVFKIGDLYAASVGTKRRPVAIIKVTDCLIYGIPMSTTEDCLNLSTYKSRFCGEGFFSAQLVSAPVEYVRDNFIGILDSPKDLKIAVLKLKELIDTI